MIISVPIKKLACSLVCLFVVAMVLSCWTGLSVGLARDDVNFSISSEPSSLDPALTKDTISFMVIFQMFDTLVRQDPDGTFVPGLAENWEINEDSTEVVFKIREGVKFHNGETMSVEDVAYSMNRAIASPATSAFTSAMDRMEILDDTHVKLYLKEPYVAIISCLSSANLAIVNKKAVEEAGDTFARNPVGTGPYKFVSWSNGEKIVMECFDDYFRGPASIKNLTFRIMSDKSTAAISLEKGEVDVLYYPSTSDRMHLMNLKNVKYQEGMASTLFYLAFNCRNGVFANEKLRQAVCYALDRESIIIGGVDGRGFPIESCIPMSTPFYDPNFKGYEYNLEKARQLMAEAGYKDGLTVTLKCNQASQYAKPSEVIQAQLREIGIKANIELMERAAYLDETQVKCDYELTFYVITNNISDPDYIATRRFHTRMEGGGNNFTLHKIDGLDELIDSARGDRDVESRRAKYEKVAEIIRDHAVIAPLYQGMTFIASDANLKGVYSSPTERHYVYEYSW